MITVTIRNEHGFLQRMKLSDYMKSTEQQKSPEEKTKRYIVTRSGERIELPDEDLDFHQCDDEPK